jgi:hypothetical protein
MALLFEPVVFTRPALLPMKRLLSDVVPIRISKDRTLVESDIAMTGELVAPCWIESFAYGEVVPMPMLLAKYAVPVVVAPPLIVSPPFWLPLPMVDDA